MSLLQLELSEIIEMYEF